MARLQIGFVGTYRGGGFFRRLIGSGPIRMTPIDVQLADKDVEGARGAAEVVWALTREAHVEPVHVGPLIELVDLRPTIAVRD